MANIFSVPDKEKNYPGYMVYALTLIWSAITGTIVTMGFLLLPEAWPRWLLLLGVLLFIAAFSLSLVRFGYTQLASWLLTIMLWSYITISCYSAGGIMAPGILMQMSVILTAGFLLGWRGGMFIGLLTICIDFGFAYLEFTGRLPHASVIHTPITRWVANIISFGSILALQYYSTNHLHAGLIAMQREMQKREEAEKTKDQTLYNLSERIKELKTLNSVSHILQNGDAPYPELIKKIAEMLPPGWQYPDITAARIFIAETEYSTHNYRPSEYSQQAEMKTASGTRVMIEVVYLQAMPECDEGPFLREERNLINTVVSMVKIDLERRERKAELKDYRYALDVSSIVSIANVDGTFSFVNENFCKASKYNAEELIGKHHSIIWSGIHSAEYFDNLKIAMQNGTYFRGEFCNKAKDGTLYWVDSSIVPFLDENGNVYQYLSINHDITRRKETEDLVKEQAEIFRAIIENTKESIYLVSPEFKVLQFNTTARERVQLTRGKELYIGADFRDYIFPEIADFLYTMFNDSLKGIHRSEEIKVKTVSGKDYWFQSKTSPVYDLKGDLIGVRYLNVSIDERKRAEAILRESEEKFRSIVEQSLVGIYIIQHGKLVYINPGFEKIFGYSKNELLNSISFEELVHEDDLEIVINSYQKRINLQTAEPQYIFRGIQNNGHTVYLEVIASVIEYNGEPAAIGTLVDITDRFEEERKINEAVLNAQEKERLQIGMELHDNVKQILAGSGLFLDIAKKNLDNKEAVTKILDDLKKYNIQAIDELRRLSHQLAPSVEEDTSLGEKIEWLILSLNLDENLSVSIHIDEFKKPLDNKTQVIFYRILQEQLSNILKYAEASEVKISIREINHLIHLQVIDNGKGFDVNTKKGGIGLENIRRRVQLLNGKVEIISSPGKGCEVNVQVPLIFSIPNADA
jgi:PAS domain S-box-containing protein